MDGREGGREGGRKGRRGADKINKYIDRSGVWTGETGLAPLS